MALVTGTDCAITVATVSYVDVVQSFELSFATEKLEYQTLGGTRTASGSETGTITITAAYDSEEATSLFDALWDAAGSAIAYVATVGGSTYTGSANAVRPSAIAKGGEVSDFTVEMSLVAIPTKAAVV